MPVAVALFINQRPGQRLLDPETVAAARQKISRVFRKTTCRVRGGKQSVGPKGLIGTAVLAMKLCAEVKVVAFIDLQRAPVGKIVTGLRLMVTRKDGTWSRPDCGYPVARFLYERPPGLPEKARCNQFQPKCQNSIAIGRWNDAAHAGIGSRVWTDVGWIFNLSVTIAVGLNRSTRDEANLA